MKKVILLLLVSSFMNTQVFSSECLPIENFKDLETYSSFDEDGFDWNLYNEIDSAEELNDLHSQRLELYSGISGNDFMEVLAPQKLTWSTITMNESGKKYDVYAYESGDNGSGFIFESGKSDKVVAYISDGLGGEILGCLKK